MKTIPEHVEQKKRALYNHSMTQWAITNKDTFWQCKDCCGLYQPAGPRQLRCTPCSKASIKRKRQERYQKRKAEKVAGDSRQKE
jgi:hypothetical protein